MADIIVGKVVQVLNRLQIVINKGKADGVTPNSRFLVYHLGEELFDPDTSESLGVLELVCGEGKPIHIQEHLTTLHTSKTKSKKSKTVYTTGLFGNKEETYDPETYEVPFDNVEVNYLVRQIR